MSPVDWVGDGDPETQSQWTQELRLTSTAAGRFDWIAGLYYFHQDFDNSSYVEFYDDFNGIVLGLPPDWCCSTRPAATSRATATPDSAPPPSISPTS